MQLGSKQKNYRGLKIKTIIAFIVLFFGIFLLDKIDFTVQKKLIKQEISNDKLITLK